MPQKYSAFLLLGTLCVFGCTIRNGSATSASAVPSGQSLVANSWRLLCDTTDRTDVGLQACFDKANADDRIRVIELPRKSVWWLKKRVTIWRNPNAVKLFVSTEGLMEDDQSCGNIDDIEAGSVNYDKGCAVLKAHADYKTFPPMFLDPQTNRPKSIYDVSHDPANPTTSYRWIDEEERTWGLLLIAPDLRGEKGRAVVIANKPVTDYKFVGRWVDGPISSSHDNNQIHLPKEAWIQNGVTLDHLIVDGNRDARFAEKYLSPLHPSLGTKVVVPPGSTCYGCGLRFPPPQVALSTGSSAQYVPPGWSSVAGARDGANVIFYGVKDPIFQFGAISHALRSSLITFGQTEGLVLKASSLRWSGRLEDAESKLFTQVTADSRTQKKWPWIANGFHCMRACDSATIVGNLFYNNTDPHIGVDGISARNLVIKNNKIISRNRSATAGINLKGSGTEEHPTDFSNAIVQNNLIDCTGSKTNGTNPLEDRGNRSCAYGILVGSNGVTQSGLFSVVGRTEATPTSYISLRGNRIYGAAVGISVDKAHWASVRLDINDPTANIIKYSGDHHHKVMHEGLCVDHLTDEIKNNLVQSQWSYLPKSCLFGNTIPYCNCFKNGVPLPTGREPGQLCATAAVRLPKNMLYDDSSFDFEFPPTTGEAAGYSYDPYSIYGCKF